MCLSFAARLFENKKGQGQLCNSTTETKNKLKQKHTDRRKTKSKTERETNSQGFLQQENEKDHDETKN